MAAAHPTFSKLKEKSLPNYLIVQENLFGREKVERDLCTAVITQTAKDINVTTARQMREGSEQHMGSGFKGQAHNQKYIIVLDPVSEN